ncbi:MAG: hypothetical protein H0X38_08845, partial [Planctomycetes bacterium]|nr:hypothetical protein [Planctomycetota bacterium]
IGPDRAAAVAAKDAAISALVDGVDDTTMRRISGEALDLAAAQALVPALAAAPVAVAEEAWVELRYATYLERQAVRIARQQRLRDLPLPADLDLVAIRTLSTEGRLTLQRRRPRTIGEAGTLPGVTQADIETLWAVMQGRLKRAEAAGGG